MPRPVRAANLLVGGPRTGHGVTGRPTEMLPELSEGGSALVPGAAALASAVFLVLLCACARRREK